MISGSSGRTASKRPPIGAQRIAEDMRIALVVFRPRGRESVAKPIELLRIDREDGEAHARSTCRPTRHAASRSPRRSRPAPRRSAHGPTARPRAPPSPYVRPCASRGSAPPHPANRARAPRCPNQFPETIRTSPTRAPPFSLGRPVSRITLVLALEAQLPTGCHSRSTSSGRTSPQGARRAAGRWHSRRGGRARSHRTDRFRVCGSWQSRGRQERVHRSLENAQNAFPTTPADLLVAPRSKR